MRPADDFIDPMCLKGDPRSASSFSIPDAA
jgi:hypothetical protein